MAKPWSETVQTHRGEVRDAILDCTAALVNQHGLHAVTMSRIAKQAGIGRATLYRYFPDVEAILVAWHQHHVAAHIQQLTTVRDQAGGSHERLEAVLAAYARTIHERARQHPGSDLAALVHRDQHVIGVRRQLETLIRDLLTQAAVAGHIRGDVAADELTRYCLHALAAAASLESEVAVSRLVGVTLDGLRVPT